MGALVSTDPISVVGQMSAWLDDPERPEIWAPFGYSIRGMAYERSELLPEAKADYMTALQLYDALDKETVSRMSSNMTFIRTRLKWMGKMGGGRETEIIDPKGKSNPKT